MTPNDQLDRYKPELGVIVRGEGKWEHTGRTYRSIARYWHVLDPILKGWLADGIESLCEITRDDVKRAIAPARGRRPARSTSSCGMSSGPFGKRA
jgi:hypothetical protein